MSLAVSVTLAGTPAGTPADTPAEAPGATLAITGSTTPAQGRVAGPRRDRNGEEIR